MVYKKKVLIFGEEGIIENKFHVYKRSVSIDELDIKRIVLSKKESYGNKGSYKRFIGYIYIYIYWILGKKPSSSLL